VRRLLGIDLGERRIGIALADADGRAVPLTTLRRADRPDDDAASINRLVDQHDVGEIVVGWPLEASGREGPQVEVTRAWLAAIGPLVRAKLVLRDERLTSHLAEQRIGPMKRDRSGGPPSRSQRDTHRARIDREAAAIILQDELDARAERSRPVQPTEDAT
jgi:putative Holliday junction resolvase